MPPLTTLVLSVAAVVNQTLLPPGQDAPTPTEISSGRSLLREGDQLADRGESNEAVLKYKQAFEKLLPGMRKLGFRHEVRRDVTAREDMAALLLKEFEEDTTPEELRASERGMKALGFFPREFDYKKTMVQVLSEEVAAFYDPKTKTMHLIREPEAKNDARPGLLARLLGRKSGFDKSESKTVIAHELTHALADQNYDLDRMMRSIHADDDRLLAVQALIEGEATLTMLGAQAEDWDGSTTARLPSKDLEWTFNLMMPLMPMASGRSLRAAPPIIGESLLFPYLRGVVFCARLTNDKGWSALDKAYEKPPLSTEQILHPEKLSNLPDAPQSVDLGVLDPGAGWREIGRNVVGEFQLSVLLRNHDGKRAAAGWDGDQFAVFDGPDDRLGLVWLTTWDTEADAQEFATSYSRFQASKLEIEGEQIAPGPNLRKLNQGGFASGLEVRGLDVAIVEGFPEAVFDNLLRTTFLAQKRDKTHSPTGRASE